MGYIGLQVPVCNVGDCEEPVRIGEYCSEHKDYAVQQELMDVPTFLRTSPNETEPNKFDQKATNPKDQIGSKKIGTTLVPDVVTYYASLGLLEGALKYGTANWSEAGVRVSIYLDACGRHLAKFKAGEWADPDTEVPHLASAIACLGIILDANLRGMITDDRSPANPAMIRWIDEAQGVVLHLKERFAECDPKHYTMQDIAPPGKIYGAD